MSEVSAWDSLRVVLSGLGLDPRRVENVVGPGHPDVDYAQGNIELKHLDAFPVRPATNVTLTEYTGEQAGWLGQRWEAGGLSWLLVRVGREWFLFDGWTALVKVFRGATQQDWRELAALHYPAPRRGWSSRVFEGAASWQERLGAWLRFDLDAMEPHTRARAMRLRCRQSLEQVATELGWPVAVLLNTETGNNPAGVNCLLDFWNS